MKNLTVIIETAEKNYSAFIEGVDGITTTGSTIDEIKQNISEAIDLFKNECKELGCEIPEELKDNYDLTFKTDVKSLLDVYSGIFSKAGLERITGINQKQLWHYASGSSKPRPEQIRKIERAIHKLGKELISLNL